jgi:hypothetical protein
MSDPREAGAAASVDTTPDCQEPPEQSGTSTSPDAILDIWASQAQQQEERRQAAAELYPWLCRLTRLKKTFCDALPSYHQTQLPQGDVVGADRHAEVADAFLAYCAALEGETWREQTAAERLRKKVQGSVPRKEHSGIAAAMFRLADGGNRAALIALIGKLAQASPLEQQTVYTAAKTMTDAVVNEADLETCRLAMAEGQPEPIAAATPATPASAIRPSSGNLPITPVSTAPAAITAQAEELDTGEPSMQPDHPTNKQAEITGDTKLSPSRLKAWGQFRWAINENAALDGATDREVYEWLEENYKQESLPSFATWGRYLREARAASGARKHNPRAGRNPGRSVVRPDAI